jgi:hypothetical protein
MNWNNPIFITSKLSLMRKLFKLTLIAIFFEFTFLDGSSQNVAINDDGTLPHASAMLDVKSATKGILIPRVALTATNIAAPIASPFTSLLVYNTAAEGSGGTAVTPGFYFWNGSAWEKISSASTPLNAWSLNGNARIQRAISLAPLITNHYCSK